MKVNKIIENFITGTVIPDMENKFPDVNIDFELEVVFDFDGNQTDEFTGNLVFNYPLVKDFLDIEGGFYIDYIIIRDGELIVDEIKPWMYDSGSVSYINNITPKWFTDFADKGNTGIKMINDCIDYFNRVYYKAVVNIIQG